MLTQNVIQMKDNVFFNSYVVLIFSSLICLTGCDNHYSTNVIDLDSVNELELNNDNSDIKVMPIKCEYPMGPIYRAVGYSDYTFLFSRSGSIIYCLKEDSVVSKLDAHGRGHGEYSLINNFGYLEDEKILYINADKKLLKYSVPSMSYLGSIDFNISTSQMIPLNKDELLAECSYAEDSENESYFRGVAVISLKTGRVIRKLYNYDLYESRCFLFGDIAKSDNDIIMSIGGLYNNSIIKWDTKGGEVNELLSFCYNPKWRAPKQLIKFLSKDYRLFDEEFYKITDYCHGCHYTSFVNSNLVVWCFPHDNDATRQIAVIVKGDNIITRSFHISGTNISVSPIFVKDGYCFDLIQGVVENTITDIDSLSSLGNEIYKAMKSQPFNNPIMYCFTVDKGI